MEKDDILESANCEKEEINCLIEKERIK